MNTSRFSQRYLASLCQTLERFDSKALTAAVDALEKARREKRLIIAFGNGGSAAIASEFIVDLNKGAARTKKLRFRGLCLTDNIPTLTAYANDIGYDDVFIEQLKNFVSPNDVVIGISGSGQSRNVLRAIEYANSAGSTTIALTSGLQGELRRLASIPILIPSTHMGHLEDCFFIITHILTYAFMDTVVATKSSRSTSSTAPSRLGTR